MSLNFCVNHGKTWEWEINYNEARNKVFKSAWQSIFLKRHKTYKVRHCETCTRGSKNLRHRAILMQRGLLSWCYFGVQLKDIRYVFI